MSERVVRATPSLVRDIEREKRGKTKAKNFSVLRRKKDMDKEKVFRMKDCFRCYMLGEGFVGIDVFLGGKYVTHRLRYYDKAIYIFKLTEGASNPPLSEWVKLNTPLLLKYIRSRNEFDLNRVCAEIIDGVCTYANAESNTMYKYKEPVEHFVKNIVEYEDEMDVLRGTISDFNEGLLSASVF